MIENGGQSNWGRGKEKYEMRVFVLGEKRCVRGGGGEREREIYFRASWISLTVDL